MKINRWMKGLILMVSILTISMVSVYAETTSNNNNRTIQTGENNQENQAEASGDLSNKDNNDDELTQNNDIVDNNTTNDYNNADNSSSGDDKANDNSSGDNKTDENSSSVDNTGKDSSGDNENTESSSTDGNTSYESTSGEKEIETKSGDENSGDESKNTPDDSNKSGDEKNPSSGDNKSTNGESGESKAKKYKITTNFTKGGKITPENPEVEEGKSQRFEIVAYKNYKIQDVYVDDRPVGTPSRYIFEDVDKEHTIKVVFLKITNAAKQAELEWNNPFNDIKTTDWFYDSVRYVNKHNLFNGISTKEFGPSQNLTRGMLVTVLFRFSNAIEYAKSTFDDVAEDTYYSQAVSWATKNGIVNGIGDNKFAPDSYITREDLATIIYRYARFKGKGFAGKGAYLLDYLDQSDISEYAYEAICWCTTTKVINGKDGNIVDPKGKATRAETATIMKRLAEHFEK